MNDETYPKALGKQIKKRRKKLKYTQTDVVDRISKLTNIDKKVISEKQLSRIENGTSGTTIENFNLIFKVLEKSPNYFMNGISDDAIEEADILIQDINYCLKDCDIKYLKDILIIAKAFADKSTGF